MNGLLEKIKKLRDSNKKIKLSHQELNSVINLLSTEDIKLRFFIGTLIIQQGKRSIPFLLKGVCSPIPEVRRSSVYLLGKLAKNESQNSLEIINALKSTLADDDPKVRKNSALILGKLGAKQIVTYLIDTLKKEQIEWVKPSFILALGAIGGEQATKFLKTYKPDFESERYFLLKALDKTSNLRSGFQFLHNISNPIPLELWTFNGLETVLKKEVKDKLDLESKKNKSGIICTESKNIYDFFSIRTFLELLIPIETTYVTSIEDAQKKVIKLLCKNGILDRILSLHEGDLSSMRYRIEINSREVKHYIRRQIISELVQVIKTVSPLFINSTSNYDIEIRIVIERNFLRLLWKPFTIPDNRFSYRVKDIPASINPVVAAGIVRFLESNLHSQHRVLDPFCGSGTILIERALAGKCRELIGVDISQKAIEAAEQNIRISGLKNIKLINNDIRNISKNENFDEIITNMPFGIRLGSHSKNIELYKDFFNLLPKILATNGSLILYTQEIVLTKELLGISNLKLLDVHRIEAGGLKPAVFIARKF